MPAWKGWNEADVRPNIPMTSGFTPINAPAPTAVVPTDSLATGPIYQTSTVPSQEPTMPAAGHVTDITGGKKMVKKTKKRASTDTKATTSKRQKIIETTDRTPMTAKGASAKAPKKAAKSSQAPSSRSKQAASARTTSKNEFTKHHDSRATGQIQPDVPQSVYAPATSMDLVQQSAPMTSMNALSAAQGQGATLYAGSRESDTPHQPVNTSRPLITPRPRRKGTPNAARAPRLSPVEEEDKFDLLLEQVAAQFDDSALALNETYISTEPATAKSQLLTPCPSDEPGPPATRRQPARKVKKTPIDEIQTEEDFLMGAASDEEVLGIGTLPPPRSPTPPSRDRKQNMREVEHDEDYGGALLTDAEKKILHELKAAKQNAVKTIVRKPFPTAVRDRSPIFGASNGAILRTCFRIGEALNVGCQAVRENNTVLLELYARVVQSSREEKPGRHQHFVLHDLYHDNPPHVNGTFDLWDQSRLWELDSKAFLVGRQGGTVCRLIGRMKRDGQKWKLEILSIWEATWEDVESVASIYAKPGEEPWSIDDD